MTEYWKYFNGSYKIYSENPEVIKHLKTVGKRHGIYTYNQKIIGYDFIIPTKKLKFITGFLKANFGEKSTLIK